MHGEKNTNVKNERVRRSAVGGLCIYGTTRIQHRESYLDDNVCLEQLRRDLSRHTSTTFLAPIIPTLQILSSRDPSLRSVWFFRFEFVSTRTFQGHHTTTPFHALIISALKIVHQRTERLYKASHVLLKPKKWLESWCVYIDIKKSYYSINRSSKPVITSSYG